MAYITATATASAAVNQRFTPAALAQTMRSSMGKDAAWSTTSNTPLPASASTTSTVSSSTAMSATATASATIGTGAGSSAVRDDRDKDALHMSPEAQWILAVLDDVGSKLSLISYLTPEIMKDKIIDALDPDMVIALRVHFQVEKQYENLVEMIRAGQGAHPQGATGTAGADATGGAGGAAGTGALNASLGGSLDAAGADGDVAAAAEGAAKLEEQLGELELCIADSVRTVARLLKQNPLLVRRLRELAQQGQGQGQGQRAPAALTFAHSFSRLRSLALSSLKLSADEERAVEEQLAGLHAQEERDHARFVSLTDKLARDRAEHAQALAERDAQIAELRRQLADLKQRTALERASLAQNLAESTEAATAEYDALERALTRDVAALQHTLDTDGADHLAGEVQKLRQKELREDDVAAKIAHYDKTLSAKQRRLEHLLQVYEKESLELKRLNVYFAERDEEAERVEAELANVVAARDAEVQVERLRHENSLLTTELLAGFEDRKVKEEKLAAKLAQLKKEGKLKPGATSLKAAAGKGAGVGGVGGASSPTKGKTKGKTIHKIIA